MQSDIGNPGPPLISAIKARRQAQDLYSADPKFKRFGQLVEKCLSSFDNVQEWADCIAFLKNLLKTLQAYPQFKDIPRKPIVSKRLSQCLNPALPTGVHQRALEVYSHIFSVLGSEGIKQDLPLWTSGIFPFFEYAATSIKPTLLNIYDAHLLPLQESLRPSMRAFILCLLPGLEEETGEFFEQVLRLLDRLSGTVSPSYFFQNIWLILLTTPPARGTALNFLSRRLPQVKAEEDITPIVGKDTGLLIRAFAATLEDENLLVQRSALDLLLQLLRLDSKTIKDANEEDRGIIMRAAYGVLLRRDLSLNRRLFTWLLGPTESSQTQDEFLRTHGLSLLVSTLKADMRSPAESYAFSRPFKIFLSLLDKWEIGNPLSNLLVVDALSMIQSRVEVEGDENGDVSTTGSTLYEAIEPAILWKHLLRMTISDLVGPASAMGGIRLTAFTLKQFHHDEEMQTYHLPVVLAALLDIFKARLQDVTNSLPDAKILAMLTVIRTLVESCPMLARANWPTLGEPTSPAVETSPTNPLIFACQYYGTNVPESIQSTPRRQERPITAVLEDVFELTRLAVAPAGSKIDEVRLAIAGQFLSTITNLVPAAGLSRDEPLAVPWNPEIWLPTMLDRLRNVSSFTLVSAFVEATLILARCDALTPNINLDSSSYIELMIDMLFDYLLPDYAGYHHRAVQLLWSLEALSPDPHLESVIARRLSTRQTPKLLKDIEAFGVLWRLTEDEALPGTRLKIPVLAVLYALKSEDTGLRQAAETWMRVSLRSGLRVLDPILVELLHSSSRKTAMTLREYGKELSGFYYNEPLDQRRILHLLDLVLAVVRHGGQNFLKSLRASLVRDSATSELAKLASAGPDTSYLDVLLSLITSYLQTEPHSSHQARMMPLNLMMQTTSVELLQAITSRGEVDDVCLKEIEAAVIGKLYMSIHRQRLDVQPRLLHLLYSVLSAASVQDIASSSADDHEAKRQSASSFLTRVLIDGVTVPTNRPIFQHWFDFIAMAMPKPHFNLMPSLPAIIYHIGREIRSSLAGTVEAFEAAGAFADAKTAVSEVDFVMYLNALESLVLASLGDTRARVASEEALAIDRSASESGGLFSFFTSDASAQVAEEPTAAGPSNSPVFRQAISVLFSITTTAPRPKSSDPGSMGVIFDRLHTRTHRALEHLWSANSTGVLECFASCWNDESESMTAPKLDAAFDMVDTLATGSQNIVDMLCERISPKGGAPAEKSRRMAADTSEWVLFSFLEQYLKRLEGPVAVQVWPRVMQLAKDVSVTSRDAKLQAYAMLRCLSVLAEHAVQAGGLDDKRLRREFQDTYIRLLDAAISIVVNRDQGAWTRRKETLALNGRDSPTPRTSTLTVLNEKPASVIDMDATLADDKNVQIIEFFVTMVCPNVRRFLVDADRITTACTNLAYNIVTPTLKGKAKPLDVDDHIFPLIQALTSVPGSLKSWRGPVYDALNDAKVFNSSWEAGKRWQPVINTLVDADRSVFPDILAKIGTAPSANIFVNREHEVRLQALSLRRLSYALLAGARNHHLAALPGVLERLVETFRSVPAAAVQAEAYLCLRVLLCRLSPHNLTSFWPVVLTELYRTFEQLLHTMPPDGSEMLPLILAASKFIDLLLVLQTEEFQVHQWIFITDTVDAIYRPNDWMPEALFDQLAEAASELPVSDARATDQQYAAHLPPTPTPVAAERAPARRPLLARVRALDSVRDLAHFFSHVSIASYEAVYASPGAVDWAAVEDGLLQDMFDGR